MWSDNDWSQEKPEFLLVKLKRMPLFLFLYFWCFSSWFALYQWHILLAVLIYALPLLIFSNHIHIVDLCFLATTSSVLKDVSSHSQPFSIANSGWLSETNRMWNRRGQQVNEPKWPKTFVLCLFLRCSNSWLRPPANRQWRRHDRENTERQKFRLWPSVLLITFFLIQTHILIHFLH